ncbi:MAG: metallopeptidase [Planctomycetales bacterium]|nr:metallopeptidase [Planctomycetales bacterium]
MLAGLCTRATGEDRESPRPPLEQQPAFYDPLETTVQGWPVKLDPALAADKTLHAQTLEALSNHLQRVKFIVAEPQLEQLRKLPIWVDKAHRLGNMQYHPDRGWLLANQHDPRLAKHVHIPRAEQLWSRQMWAKHPYVVLHELAHAYHDQVLSFDDRRVIKVFDEAKQDGIYEQVLLYTGRKVRHYGLSNHKEYFAESTEAYFGVNDFYPFVRAELKEHDPRMFALLREIWGPVP